MGTILKRMTAVLLLLLMMAIPVSEVCAEPQNGQAASQETELSDLEKQKKASYDTVPETNKIDGWPQGPQVYGKSAIVMDMDSKAILYGKKIDEQHYPASITKLLTVLLALENSSLDDEVVMSQESIDILRSDYASIGMRAGEIISMKDALYATLFASANEVAYAVGENVGRQIPSYAILDLQAVYKVCDYFEIFGAIENVTDKKYVSTATYSTWGDSVYPGQGRIFKIGVNIRY